jgi:hypothetical protein
VRLVGPGEISGDSEHVATERPQLVGRGPDGGLLAA